MGSLSRSLIIFLLLVFTCPASFQEQDRDALLAFFTAIPQIPPSLASWSNVDFCKWTGVSCQDGRVTEFTISGVYLHARIPPEFGGLSKLRVLNLSLTNLTGYIPWQLGKCVNLEVLDLSNNVLEGNIPSSFGNLGKVTTLWLQNNKLQNVIPRSLGDCTDLEDLRFFDNNLTGTIPDEFGRLKNLRILRGGGNRLLGGNIPTSLGNCSNLELLGLAVTSISGSIPPELGQLKKLQTLALYDARLTGQIPPELGSCSSLQGLFLYLNRLTGTIPEELGNLQQLSRIMLWNNTLTGNIPASLGQCTSLIMVDFSVNGLSGSIPREIGRLSSLQNFFASANRLTGTIPAELGNCTDLVQLEFDTNQLTGPLPDSLGRLSKLQRLFAWQNGITGRLPPSLANCTSLEWIDLSFNRISGPIPAGIFSLPFLQKLLILNNRLSGSLPGNMSSQTLGRVRLSQNILTGTIPGAISNLRNLSFFDVSLNRLTGGIPPEIGNVDNLQFLDLHGNSISGTLPASIGKLNRLGLLDLSQNSIHGDIPREIGGCESLGRLKLSGNSFSGAVPRELGVLKQLQFLDLSENSLAGDIPWEIGQMDKLDNLELQGNAFSGKIPESFSALTHLDHLDLSRNILDGNLQMLSELSSLSFLNVSFNRFSGQIPNSEVFRRMNANSFIGNNLSPLCVVPGNRNAPIRPSISVVVGILFGGTFLIVVLGSVLLYRRCQGFATTDMGTWKMELYYKWNSSISAYDIVKSLDERSSPIGRGSSGNVYQVKMPDGNTIAIKKIHIAKRGCNLDHASFDSEICTLGTKIRHKNIVRLIGYCSNRETGLLLYDFKINGSLGELLHDKRRHIDWELRYKIALGAAQGIAYLHHDCNPPILHRDIKANNILLGAGMEPFVADFGLAKFVKDEDASSEFVMSRRIAGTTGYIAPEYSHQVKITTKSDVYSYGVVLLEILTGRRAVLQDTTVVEWVKSRQPKVEALDPRLQGMPDPFIHEMLQTFGIALLCCHVTPSERPSMKDVVDCLKHIKHVPEDGVHKNMNSSNIRKENNSSSSSSTSSSSEQQKFLLDGSPVFDSRQKSLRMNQKLLELSTVVDDSTCTNTDDASSTNTASKY